jgi:hypothetical protein
MPWSRPKRVESWATSTISRTPWAASARTSLAMSSTLRLRFLPRSVGMMQKEQV